MSAGSPRQPRVTGEAMSAITRAHRLASCGAALLATVPPASGHHVGQHGRPVDPSGAGTHSCSSGAVGSLVSEVNWCVPCPPKNPCDGWRRTAPNLRGRVPCGRGTLRLSSGSEGRKRCPSSSGTCCAGANRGIHGEHRLQLPPRKLARPTRKRRCSGADREVGTGDQVDVDPREHHAVRDRTHHGPSTSAAGAACRQGGHHARGIRRRPHVGGSAIARFEDWEGSPPCCNQGSPAR